MKRAHLTLKVLMLPFPVECAGQRVRFGGIESDFAAG
jgi:hypothetical protein